MVTSRRPSLSESSTVRNWPIEKLNAMSQRNLADELTNLRAALGSEPNDVADILLAISEIEPQDFHAKNIGSFFYSTWKEIAAMHNGHPHVRPASISPVSIKSATQVAATTSNSSRHLCTALDYLYLWAEVHEYLHKHHLQPLRYTEILGEKDHVLALERRLQTCRSNLSTEYGLFQLQGLLRGLSDREEAAHLFRLAQSDHPTFADSQLLDIFVGTYLSNSDIAAKVDEIAVRRTDLLASFEILAGDLPTQEGSTVLLFSCDISFFGIFFPYWASVAMYLREHGIHLHFVLVGRKSEVSRSLENGLKLAMSMARLRGLAQSVVSECLSFSQLEPPSYVGELRTLYACARFLVARALASTTAARMLIVDIDTEVNSDPRASLREIDKLSPTQLPIVAVRGLHALIPAYRLPAYRIVLPVSDHASTFLLDIEDYIYAALPRDPSWLLDQNALDYATGRMVSRHGSASLVEVNGHLSVFQQRPIGRMYKLMRNN